MLCHAETFSSWLIVQVPYRRHMRFWQKPTKKQCYAVLILLLDTWVSNFSVKSSLLSILTAGLRSAYNLIIHIHLLLAGRRAHWSDRNLICKLDVDVTCFLICGFLEICKMQIKPLVVCGSLFTWPVTATFWNQLTSKDLDWLTIPPGAQLRVNHNHLGRISQRSLLLAEICAWKWPEKIFLFPGSCYDTL